MVSRSVGCIIYVMCNLAMLTIVPGMSILKLSHRDILSHTLMLLSELSGGPVLVVFQAKRDLIRSPPVCIGVLLSVLGYICKMGNLL